MKMGSMEKKKKEVSKYTEGYGTGKITLGKLVFYNLLFFVPIILLIIFSRFIAGRVYDVFETTPNIVTQVIMIFFTIALFLVIIPFIRNRESVGGVRYSLIGFLIVAIGLTLPSIIFQKNFGLLLVELPHIATYVLLTFIYCPEVLGMDIDISKWFKHYKQLLIIFIYCSILLLYVSGFGGIYYNMAKADPASFSHDTPKETDYPLYFYFSTITFTTIGYGDITPISTGARFLVSVEAIVGTIVNVIFIAILFLYISNFQAFAQSLKEEEKEIKKEEKEIRSIERRMKKK
jgi:hypothetical protein